MTNDPTAWLPEVPLGDDTGTLTFSNGSLQVVPVVPVVPIVSGVPVDTLPPGAMVEVAFVAPPELLAVEGVP